ncbi:ABC transporter permease [Puia sp. P3]|uniref:ABC transporter permease n=1 Tax=Puia sp. P3 TaxID=3423952 RepID=UPI003D675379
MLRNYLLTALRNIWKNKTYSFLNIFGLAVGVTCAGLIFLWVEAEWNYDPFPKKEYIYNVRTNQTYNGVIRTFGSSPGPLAAAMQADIPGVVSTCRTRDRKMLFSLEDKNMYEAGIYADPTLFGMFSMSFLEGSAATSSRDLNSVALSETMARQFFGSVSGVVGRTIRVANKENFTVSSVYRDFPLNSTIRPDYVIPFASFEKDNQWLQYWGANGLSTFVELAPSANPARINLQLKDFIRQKSEQKAGAQPLLIAMKDWRLRDEFVDGKQSGGRIQYVRLFTYIACIILLIACINFMNLSTARSEKRAREVGVRKVLGAERGRLISQFIGESVLLSTLSVALGVLLIGLVLPAFNLLVKEQLSLGIGQPLHILSPGGDRPRLRTCGGQLPRALSFRFQPGTRA